MSTGYLKRRAVHPRKRLLAAALAALLPLSTAQAWRLDWIAELGLEYNDNVTLSETDPVDETIARPSIGFQLSQDGATVQASVRGLAEYRHYLGGTYGNEFLGELDGIVNWVVAPERMHFSVQDRLSIQPVNQAAPDAPDNRQQTNVLAAGPTFFFRFSPTLRGQAELRWIDTYAEETVGFNTERISGAVRAIKDLGATRRLSANIQGQTVDVDDNTLAPDYDRYDVFGRYSQSLTHLDMALELGYSLLESEDGGNRTSPLIRGQVGWRPSERSTFNALVERRFSDTAEGLIETGGGDGTVPSLPPIIIIGDNDAINALTYEETHAEIGYTYAGARATMAVTPFYRQLDYVDVGELPGPDQTGHGVLGEWAWLLRPTWSLSMSARYEQLRFDETDIDVDTWLASVWLRKQWTPNWSGRLGVSRYERDNSGTNLSADQNVVYLAMTYTR
jgi:hypothetical protein